MARIKYRAELCADPVVGSGGGVGSRAIKHSAAPKTEPTSQG